MPDRDRFLPPPVLVIRSAPGAKASAQRLRARGIPAIACSVLHAGALAAPPPVAASPVGAFAVTSAHGVRFLAARAGDKFPEWFALRLFAVGPATARVAVRAGFRHVEAAEGDSLALVSLITRRWKPGSGLILHAAGTAAGGELADHLLMAGLNAAYWPLYSMIHAAKLPMNARRALKASPDKGPMPDPSGIAAFYSAEAATAFLALVVDAGMISRLRTWTAISLSPRIHAMLASGSGRDVPAPNLLATGGRIFGEALIAARPDAAAMIEAIRAIAQDRDQASDSRPA